MVDNIVMIQYDARVCVSSGRLMEGDTWSYAPTQKIMVVMKVEVVVEISVHKSTVHVCIWA